MKRSTPFYTLHIPPQAQREIKKLPKRYQKAIRLALHELKEDPFQGKPLSRELTGRFTYKIGVYRIVYKINKKDKIVLILTAGHRARVYQ